MTLKDYKPLMIPIMQSNLEQIVSNLKKSIAMAFDQDNNVLGTSLTRDKELFEKEIHDLKRRGKWAK